MRRLRMIAAVAILALPAGSHAAALPGGGVTAQEVARVLQAKGYRAEVGKADDGTPKINNGLDGSSFTVWFYTCKSDRCAAIQFAAGFDLKDGVSLAKINAWNRDKRFGRGYLDEEMNPYVQYDVDFEIGGTTEAIGNAVEVWASVFPTFKKYLDIE